MTPESCGRDINVCLGNLLTAFAAPRRSVHHNDDFAFGYAELPTYPSLLPLVGLYEASAGTHSSAAASSSYFDGHDVLMTSASKT